MRSHQSKLVLDYWIFAACAIGIGGFLFGFLGLVSFILQGDIWVYQILCIVTVAVVALIIPGYLYERRVKNGI